MPTRYVCDTEHYNEVIARCASVKSSLFTELERALCPRVHFKIFVFDGMEAYIGSANLTGAGMGMKSRRRRNFEAGILTDDPALVAAAMDHFDSVWAGFRCRDCGRKEYCGDPIVK